MKSPTPEAQSAEDAFQMLYPICYKLQIICQGTADDGTTFEDT